MDLSAPCEDNIFTPEAVVCFLSLLFSITQETFLKQRIKVNGKAGQLGNQVTVSRSGTTVKVQAQAPFSKRYVKYLVKKFLKQQQLRDWIRIVSSNKNTYTLKYFNIQDDEGAEEGEK